MTDSEIYQQLTEVFHDIFDDPTLVLKPETSAADIPDWTSFIHINLIVATEDRFGVKFSTADIERLKNVGDLVALVRSKRAPASKPRV
jgi:acyl carrier protein